MPSHKTLKTLGTEDIKKIIPEKDSVDKIDGPVLSLSGSTKTAKNSPLVDIEIAFRECKASGVFKD